MVIATVGIALGLVFAGTASAATLAENHSPGGEGSEPVLYQTNNTTVVTNETVVNGTEEGNASVGANETDDGNDTVGTNETATIAPGTFLSGAVGAHRAELEGSVRGRAFGLSVAAAVSNGSKAGLIVNHTDRLETRLRELERTRDTLEAAYENGSIQNATYQVHLTILEARISSTERMINQTINETDRLPPEIRHAYGVNETRLDRLRTQARNLTGPEVAQIARRIGGPMTGQPAGVRGPPAHAGPNGSMGPPDTVPGRDDNTTRGPPTNRTRGPPINTSAGQRPNATNGPPSNGTMGAPDGSTRGPPNGRSTGPPAERGQHSAGNGRNTSTNRSNR